jgi:hypothetical protein
MGELNDATMERAALAGEAVTEGLLQTISEARASNPNLTVDEVIDIIKGLNTESAKVRAFMAAKRP